jgi:hypothetical protein
MLSPWFSSGTWNIKFQVPGVASVPYCWGGFEGGVWVLLPLELPLGLVLLLPVLLEPLPVLLESVEAEPLLVSVLLLLMLESLDFFLWCFLAFFPEWSVELVLLWSVEDVLVELCPADEGLDCELALDPWSLVWPADWLDDPEVSWLWATTKALASSRTANIPIRFFILALLFSFCFSNCVDPQSFPLRLARTHAGPDGSGREVASDGSSRCSMSR